MSRRDHDGRQGRDDAHEARRADELEALLAARRLGREPATGAALPPADAALADALLDLAGGVRPDAAFADALEAELRAKAAARGAAAVPPGARPRPLHPPRPPARRWPLWVAAAVLLLAALLLVPPVQAAIEEVLGVVHIIPGPPKASPTGPTPTPLTSALDLAGETTLADARQRANFPVRLPAYPADLGPPQHVYLQDLAGAAVVLVWVDPRRPDHVRMSLHELSDNLIVYKVGPTVIQETTVHGQRALWTDGPYIVQVAHDGQVFNATRRLVTGHVLIWTEGNLTYRLETDVPLAEAVRIAESLR